MAARHEEGCYEVEIPMYLLVCKERDYRTMTSGGVAKGTVFQWDTAGSWFQSQRYRQRKDGGGGYRTATIVVRKTSGNTGKRLPWACALRDAKGPAAIDTLYNIGS